MRQTPAMPMLAAHPRTTSALALVIASLLFFVIGTFQIRSPGLMYDEAADAVPAMELLAGQTPSVARSITLFSRSIPIMQLDHIGPASIYTSLAGFALFGVSVETLRVTQLFVGWVTLLLLWLLARSWAGASTATIAALCCATAPVFVWWSRAGANWTVPLLPLALGMLLALTQWWRRAERGNPWALALAALLFGMGAVTKILFVWLLAPLLVTALLFRRALLPRLRALGLGAWVFVIAALLLGLLPLLIHNIPDLSTVQFVLDNAAQTRLYGHNNLDFGNNLLTVLREFLRAMGGDILTSDAPASLPLGAIAFVLAIAGALALWRRMAARPSFVFIMLTPLLVLPLSTVSTSSIGATYVFVIVPLAWLLIAWVFTAFGRTRALQVAMTTAIVTANLFSNVLIHSFFWQTGGRGHWSDAIYALAQELETVYAGRPIVAMDWGFRRNVNLLTRDAVEPRETFGYSPQPDAAFANTASVLLRDPATLYLLHTPQTTLFGGRFDALQRVATQQHKTLTVEQTYNTRDGEPVILLYSARDTARTFDISPTLATRNAVFDNGVTLLGGRITHDPARSEVKVELQWQSNVDALPADNVLLHVIEQSNGALVANGDHQPAYGNYPFDRWQRGEVVIDTTWIALPEALPPGVYQIRVGVYDRATQTRYGIRDPLNDVGGNTLMLQTFEVR
jgi:4-amino-4-deoxy-L-arabinose transferase-like glycosyltransferase